MFFSLLQRWGCRYNRGMVQEKIVRLAVLSMIVAAGICAGAPKKKVGFKPSADLGNVLYIGDSITHGYATPSYRWALHKILVDNGVKYEEVGVETGNRGEYLPPQATYMGREFKNLHAAMSSQRAYETSGRKHTSNRLDGTDIFDWLQLPQADKEGRRVEGKPDMCFILLGTNDTLSDYGKPDGVAKHIAEVTQALTNKTKGDIAVIIDAIRKSNPKAKIVLLSIPAWGETTMNNTAADYKSVLQGLNKRYAELAKAKKVFYVDVNEGLQDPTCTETPGRGVADFFNANDKLHPTKQGDLIIAGLIARTLGYAGRTAGLPRKAVAKFDSSASMLIARAKSKDGIILDGEKLTMKPGSKLEIAWEEENEAKKGFAAQILLAAGNGAAGGWQSTPLLTLAVGNGEHTGKLCIKEGSICWSNGAVLYPPDMSVNKKPLRVTWVAGDEGQGIDAGFYVWLGDVCIGEGLPDAEEKVNGLSLENPSRETIEIQSLTLDGTSSAPAPTGFVAEEQIADFVK